MEYRKPQGAIMQGGKGVYPLTTADQVILADGSRLEKGGKLRFASLQMETASLAVAGWSGNEQTVSVSGVTASNAVVVTPSPASHEHYAECMVRCSAQSAGKLTFTCSETPTAALNVNVLILE